MNPLRLYKRILAKEGFRSKPYKDHMGNWTIGIGNTMIFGAQVTRTTPPVTLDQAKEMCHADIYQAILDACLFFPDLFVLDSVRQEILIEMAYQMGYARMNKFIRLRRALEDCDWIRASSSMRSSLWYRQTPGRVEELATMMETGIYQ
jgi:lysozyme